MLSPRLVIDLLRDESVVQGIRRVNRDQMTTIEGPVRTIGTADVAEIADCAGDGAVILISSSSERH
jgi:hypothetical protein